MVRGKSVEDSHLDLEVHKFERDWFASPIKKHRSTPLLDACGCCHHSADPAVVLGTRFRGQEDGGDDGAWS